MIVSAVVCPPVPALVPGLAAKAAGALLDLRRACLRAVGVLGDADAALIISTGVPGRGLTWFEPGTVISSAGLARSDRTVVEPAMLSDGPADSRQCWERAAHPLAEIATLSIGTVVGARLLVDAGIIVPTRAVQIDFDGPVELFAAAAGKRIGLLIMADGAACHGPHAPGAEDSRSAGFDAAIQDALAAGDPQMLAAATRDRVATAAALRCTGLPAFAALAGLTGGAPPTRSRIDYSDAPLGVGYFVAVWQWD